MHRLVECSWKEGKQPLGSSLKGQGLEWAMSCFLPTSWTADERAAALAAILDPEVEAAFVEQESNRNAVSLITEECVIPALECSSPDLMWEIHHFSVVQSATIYS